MHTSNRKLLSIIFSFQVVAQLEQNENISAPSKEKHDIQPENIISQPHIPLQQQQQIISTPLQEFIFQQQQLQQQQQTITQHQQQEQINSQQQQTQPQPHTVFLIGPDGKMVETQIVYNNEDELDVPSIDAEVESSTRSLLMSIIETLNKQDLTLKQIVKNQEDLKKCSGNPALAMPNEPINVPFEPISSISELKVFEEKLKNAEFLQAMVIFVSFPTVFRLIIPRYGNEIMYLLFSSVPDAKVSLNLCSE